MSLDLGKSAGLVAALGGAIATLYGGWAFIDVRYVKTSELDAVRSAATLTNLRLEEKILTDRVQAIQERIWLIEDRYGKELLSAAPSVKEEHRQMLTDLAEIDREIQSVMDAYRQHGYPASAEYYHYERPHR